MVEHTLVEIDNVDDGDDVASWSAEKVKTWLRHNGYQELENNLSNHLPITGEILLTLSLDDLRQPPFNIQDRDEREHLLLCIETLKNVQLTKYMKKINCNGVINGYYNGVAQSLISNKAPANGHLHESDEYNIGSNSNSSTPLLSEDQSDSNPSGRVGLEQYPRERLKTFVALLYILLGFVVSVLVLQLVHERVPDKTEDPPLPDVFFDVLPKRIEWAFDVCETVGMVLVAFLVILGIFHRHRLIIARRFFFVMGTLYLYRSVTMFVTTLPVPGMHFHCAEKTHYKISLMLQRAFGLLYGGGLTVTGSHHLCGDYLFSGHTIVLVLTYLFISEYSSRRWWWLHWLSWLLSAVGILCILLAHDHYTVDVVVAYLLTTRLFWTYHTMCNSNALKDASNSNLLSRAWWFPIFHYFEVNVTSNNGTLPCQFEWPLPWPQRFRSATHHRRPLKGV